MPCASELRSGRRAWVAVAAACAAWLLPAAASAADAAQDVAPAATPEVKVIALRLPSGTPVAYRGYPNRDASGVATPGILYPAPNLGGFIAAVVTHALISEELQRKQARALQAHYDEVLRPYRDVIERISYRELVGATPTPSAVIQYRLLDGPPEPHEWLIESAPSFAMTQDRKALVLENAIRLFAPAASAPSATRLIRVISTPLPDEEPAALQAAWADNRGQRLVDESRSLFLESLALASAEAEAAQGQQSTAPQRTFRYRLGGTLTIERAQLVSERCDRLVLLTLRNEVLSAPKGAHPEPCPEAGPAKP